ncbi:hemolysin-type calcium-binding repeat family protein [Lyngbya aestuarii BL J]|uniref:Hemolysin-type calcium-binding repeat family protein n=1 Tax=Lyngbya aestuarii BL J TaxID=1348334 RepID=U7QKW8_9CYAN|nr:calcium-binding protein [Lyngbya aestuarii]ERT08609.1 hemolysin-type calcium-binding repeat family protein [Lyngbya aestuarii BL J]
MTSNFVDVGFVEAGFAGEVDPARQVAFGTELNDLVGFPTSIRDSDGVESNADISQLEISLLDGNDTLNGSNVDTSAVGNGTALIVLGNTGNDNLTGTSSTDSLFGGQDQDEIDGFGGNDQVFGNLGDDTLAGALGDDFVFGGQGNDVVSGGPGNNVVFGDLGDDTLIGSTGVDTLTGGPGVDRFFIAELPNTTDPAAVSLITDFSTVPGETDGIQFIVPSVASFISISPLQTIQTSGGPIEGFLISDITGTNALLVVQNNPNITRPLEINDFLNF